MMDHLIDYAHYKTHSGARVADAETGEQIQDVREANAKEGWFVRLVRDADGKFKLNRHRSDVVEERVERAIKIWWSET